MSLYKYEKDNRQSYRSKEEKYIKLDGYTEKEDLTIWKSVGSGYNVMQTLVNKSRLANILIPSLFIIIGVLFIARHWWPKVQTWAQEQSGILNQGTTSPVSETFIDYSKYISNPAGLGDVAKDAFEQHVLQEDSVSKNYKDIFYISIPAIGIEKIPVQANVDSTTEEVYNQVLTNSLAHFENTGLPISEVQNNIVIYGHSATSNYNPSPKDPEVAFSFLPNLKVGDDIYIEIEGQTYHYKMYKSKIVEPTDISIITGTKNKRTLTLFTCFPLGADANRYVAIARPVD